MTARWPVACLAVAVVLAGAAAVRADMLVAQYAAQTNDRFYSGTSPAKAFIGDAVAPALDFSGVGLTSDGRWVTMISPSYFLSAYHYRPAEGSTVTFYFGNATSQPSSAFTVDSSSYSYTTNIPGYGNSDLYLGKLTTPVPANIAKYPVPMFGPDSAYFGRQLYVYGLSSASASTPVPGRVGTNTIADIDRLDYTSDHPSYTQLMEFDYNPNVPNSAFLELFDSGGPSFLVYNGQLAVVGIHYVHDTDLMVSGDSFVPYYVDQLNAHMSGEQLTLVPEPASLAMLATGLLAGLIYWRRTKRRT